MINFNEQEKNRQREWSIGSSPSNQRHMKEMSAIETWAENAAEYLTTGNKRITKDTVVIISSVTGNTKRSS